MQHVTVPTASRAPTGTTNVYLTGRDGFLLDPGETSDELVRTIEQVEPSHIAVTHHHRDHTDAVGTYAEAFGLTVWARAGRETEFEAATGYPPDRTYRPGATLGPDGPTVIDTPGHSPEHVAFDTGDGLVSGDLAVAEGSVVVGAPEGDMRAYLTSLRRVLARNPARLYPGHGPAIEDPRQTCHRLLKHRRDREREVATAVNRGFKTPDAIVDTVYEKDVSAVRDLARATVVAHLEKLAIEGSVDWDGNIAHAV